MYVGVGTGIAVPTYTADGRESEEIKFRSMGGVTDRVAGSVEVHGRRRGVGVADG